MFAKLETLPQDMSGGTEKCKGKTHVGHLFCRATFESGTFTTGSRNLTNSKRRFNDSDFLELVEQEWSDIHTFHYAVQTCQKAGCVTGRVWTRWSTARPLNLPEIGHPAARSLEVIEMHYTLRF
jgi:hypothetical protein